MKSSVKTQYNTEEERVIDLAQGPLTLKVD